MAAEVEYGGVTTETADPCTTDVVTPVGDQAPFAIRRSRRTSNLGRVRVLRTE